VTPSRTPARRLLGAVLSLGLTAGALLTGATLVASPASAASDFCTASMSPTSIHPGESATMHIVTSGDDYLPSIVTVNGHVVPGATVSHNTSDLTWSYATWFSFGAYAEVMNPTSAGYRLYSNGTSLASVTDTTPFLCEAQVALLPAAVDQTISFGVLENKPLSAGTATVSAVASSGLPVTYTSLDTSVCTVNAQTGVVTLVAQGECQIRADQAGNASYNAAPSVYRDFYVQLPQTITFAPVADQVLGTAPFALDVSSNSGRYIDVVSNTPTVCAVHEHQPEAPVRYQKASSFVPPTVELLALGTCSVTASRGESNTWLPATPVTRTFKIKAAVTPAITLTAPWGAPMSAKSVALGVSTNVDGAVTVASLTPAVCTVSGKTVSLRKAGTCTVRASQDDVESVTKSFPVWATPVLPATGKATTTVTALGMGEESLTLRATPSSVCKADGKRVLLLAAGSCKVTVAKGGTTLRSRTIKVTFPKKTKPSDQLELAGTAYFDFDSAKLTAKAKKTLRSLVPTLKEAKLVVVYGNTFGPGKNSKHSKALSAARAKAVADYLAKRGVKAKAVKVAAAMKNPVSDKAAKNRRADIYVVKQTVVV
jgi:outer membrane protein OmpA-like peptidoglycan-associated protein